RSFLRWPDAPYAHVGSPLTSPEQFGPGQGLETVRGAEVGVGQLANLCPVLYGHAAQVQPQVEHLRIPKLVVNASAVAPAPHQADLSKHLKMLTRIRDGKAGFGSQPFDGALAIGKDVDDLEPPAVRQRLGQASELIEQGGLGCSAVWCPIQVFH